MNLLSPSQIKIVSESLTKAGLDYGPLQDELIDHACCLIESELQDGQDFDTALQVVLVQFNPEQIKTIQDQTIYSIHKKPKLMKLLSITAASFLFITFLFNYLQTDTVQQQIDETEKNITKLLNEPPSLHPLGNEYELSSGFGMRKNPFSKLMKHHTGVDFKAPTGTPILATSAGKVIQSREDRGMGKNIMIQHDDIYQTKYCHLSKLLVNKGQVIEKGDTIGLVGSSGLSTAPHLHYEVIKNGERVDPAGYLMP